MQYFLIFFSNQEIISENLTQPMQLQWLILFILFLMEAKQVFYLAFWYFIFTWALQVDELENKYIVYALLDCVCLFEHWKSKGL